MHPLFTLRGRRDSHRVDRPPPASDRTWESGKSDAIASSASFLTTRCRRKSSAGTLAPRRHSNHHERIHVGQSANKIARLIPVCCACGATVEDRKLNQGNLDTRGHPRRDNSLCSKVYWSGRADLNRGPPAPKAGALQSEAHAENKLLTSHSPAGEILRQVCK